MNTEVSIKMKLLVTGIYSIITIGGGIILFKIVYKKPLSELGLIRKYWLRYTVFGLLFEETFRREFSSQLKKHYGKRMQGTHLL
ncbi:MAG: hypothetical protein Q4F05_15110 [bacterium]|nr:hypothetical protein [bacterium]